MNIVVLHGHVTKDPEIRYAPIDNMAIAKYSLAVNRPGKDKGTDFFNCTAFGKQGEFAEKYLKKGTEILISGRLQQDSWTDKDGNKRSSVGVIVDRHEFCGPKDDRDRIPDPKSGGSDFIDIPEGNEELPFNF